MAYKVNFAGVNLEDYCTVLNINRSVLPPRTNSSKVIPTMNGSFFTGFNYGERIISLEVIIKGKNKIDYVNNIRELSNILNVDNPSKLIISDDPDIYYYAVLDGSTDLTKTLGVGAITVTFICHDPIAYSNKWQTFQTGSKNIIKVSNDGNMPADPLIDVIFKKKACFFQSTNRSGETVLIGLPKDLTKNSSNLSDVVVDDDCSDITTFNNLSESLLDNNRVVTGGFSVGLNGESIICNNYGTAENTWHGAAFRKSLGSNISEFEVSVDLLFSSRGKNYEEPKPEPKPPEAPEGTPEEILGTYKVVNCGGLWINKEANTNNPLYAMAPGTVIYPIEKKGIWMKHTHTNRFGSKYTGWSSNKYLQKISNSSKKREEEFAENQLGLLEVYGFDQNGAKLFKVELSDNSEWFENVEPKAYVGSSKVLEDGKINTKVRVKQKENGEKENLPSGAVGRWNDFNGKLIIKREKNQKGEYLWSFNINKYVNGRLVETLATKNSLNSPSYPKGSLNYLGFYIGKYGDKKSVDVLAVDNVKVKKLNMKTDQSTDNNLYIFEPNDSLQVNFGTGEVLLNGLSISTEIDIGSSFFKVPSGESDFIVRSDDETAIICCGIQNKFI